MADNYDILFREGSGYKGGTHLLREETLVKPGSVNAELVIIDSATHLPVAVFDGTKSHANHEPLAVNSAYIENGSNPLHTRFKVDPPVKVHFDANGVVIPVDKDNLIALMKKGSAVMEGAAERNNATVSTSTYPVITILNQGREPGYAFLAQKTEDDIGSRWASPVLDTDRISKNPNIHQLIKDRGLLFNIVSNNTNFKASDDTGILAIADKDGHLTTAFSYRENGDGTIALHNKAAIKQKPSNDLAANKFDITIEPLKDSQVIHAEHGVLNPKEIIAALHAPVKSAPLEQAPTVNKPKVPVLKTVPVNAAPSPNATPAPGKINAPHPDDGIIAVAAAQYHSGYNPKGPDTDVNQPATPFGKKGTGLGMV